ncbi:MAG: hypothetical protein K9W46_03070 [Candidatus Heimdallarchaeum endolithica]|uniref:Thiamine-phosphate synthase ThiN domain-containing protein n=1 Tax=Candidatus Heimdallarchaeum endolithica TaxID=2876572 RepID=A0A9Y1FP63_9ARCH|nr:MAG: hypothetical protein K9W46_03070 [Candidatus Heimdallarchaeum endolithica]
MRFPCEYVTSEFLPGLRIRVSHLLREAGYSQNEIAEKLSVKQPVVVSYLKAYEKRITEGKEDNFHLDNLANEIAEAILEGKPTSFLIRTVCTRCKSLRVDSFICTQHKKLIPELSNIKNCNLCMGFPDKMPTIEERKHIKDEMIEMFNLLSTYKDFINWIPEIGCQIAHCDDRALELDDVASFPGRLVKVKNEIRRLSDPEFGESKTMAHLLIWIRKFQSNIKWILSLKNKPKLQKKLKNLEIPVLETQEIDTKWKKTLGDLSKNPDIFKFRFLLDKGGKGYEPIAYIFAENKNELEALLNKVLE